MEGKRKSLRLLAISLILCLISMVGAAVVQTSAGKVTVKDIRWETPSGYTMSALLLIPESATKDNPAPAIVTSHGWYNNREMQDLNYVEYSRRGYVVMSIDMYGHGNSDVVSPEEWANRGTGMYDAVELMASLPYVDTTKIGVTGHSNGARAANWSVLEDNKKDPSERLISSVLLVANDAMYSSDPGEPLYWSMRNSDQEYTNNYGTRDVGIIAAQYDEFFFRSIAEDGSITPPREFIHTEFAQSFLHFGTDPKEERVESNIYKQEIDGQNVSRVIYTPNQIHPWNHLSATVVKDSLEFFEDSLGSSSNLEPGSQVWQFKTFFNFIGLVGFFLFIVSFTKVMLYTSAFESLRAKAKVTPASAPVGRGIAWFWGGLIVSAIISGYSYLKLFTWASTNRPDFFPQAPVFYIGVWSLVMGIVTLAILYATYKFYLKGTGFSLEMTGVKIKANMLFKTILLSILVSVAAFSIVFVADYFFKADFRLWVIAIKAFTPDKLVLVLKYLPFLLAFYVANSIAVNSFNYLTGKKKWSNIAILAVFNGLSAAVIIAIQYTAFFVTGHYYFTSVSPIVGIWLFPIVIIIPLSAFITRSIFKETNNPYLGGIIYAIVVTVMMVTNTLTQ